MILMEFFFFFYFLIVNLIGKTFLYLFLILQVHVLPCVVMLKNSYDPKLCIVIIEQFAPYFIILQSDLLKYNLFYLN